MTEQKARPKVKRKGNSKQHLFSKIEQKCLLALGLKTIGGSPATVVMCSLIRTLQSSLKSTKQDEEKVVGRVTKIHSYEFWKK